ncbi:hypothetical protein HOI71_28345 [Candidatus Poribacteria bacterium]|nr:hypothetical protein [Candidatus Poribacteria bacterium]
MAMTLTALLAATTVASADTRVLAGAATADITPPTGFPMWGYGDRHDLPSVGVLDPLYAKALVLQAGDDKVALVGLDLGRSPGRGSMATIRSAVAAEAGVGTVMMVGSHTHHGPVIETESWPTPDAPYVRELEKRLIGVIVSAAAAVVPAHVGVAAREVALNRNRHWKGDEPPVDRELSFLHTVTPDGRAIATLVNYAAHPTLEEGERMEFSADYPGHLMRAVEAVTGGVCVFMQGAAGDLSAAPAGERSPASMGGQLAEATLAALTDMTPVTVEDARIDSREDDFDFESRVDWSNRLIIKAYSDAFYPGIVKASVAEFEGSIRPHLTTVLLSGTGVDVAFAGVSGELFCDLGLRLKERSPVQAIVFGYCNGHQLYFPTIEAAAMGGYGGDPAVAPIEVGGPEVMVDRALIRIFEMGGEL